MHIKPGTETMTRQKLFVLITFLNILTLFTIRAQSGPSNFEFQKIGNGVYAVIRKDPPGLMCDGNSGIIINENDVVIVDAPEATREIIARLKKLTDKPVKYVINTHWHDDHITGNEYYRDTYPDVEFIAHKNTKEYLPVQGLVNRNNMIQSAPGGVAYLKSLLQKNESFGGGPITDEERESYLSDIKLVEHYLSIVPATEFLLPTITFEDTLTLKCGNRKIELKKIGDGHTAGDIVVFLPKEKILFTGDLVVAPIPLVGSEQSNISSWSTTLRNLRSLEAGTIVPGHGKVMHDDTYIKNMESLFNSIYMLTGEAVSSSLSLDDTIKSINLERFESRFAGDSKLLKTLFSYYVKGPSIRAAYNELKK
jgi:cyclase